MKGSIVNSINALLDGEIVSQCGNGSWREVINLNMTNPSHQCPLGWVSFSNPRACSQPPRTSGACAQVSLPVGTPYSKVCGRILGFGNGMPDAFFNWTNARSGRNYVDGVTVFKSSSPSEHVRTLATDQDFGDLPRCPCNGNN